MSKPITLQAATQTAFNFNVKAVNDLVNTSIEALQGEKDELDNVSFEAAKNILLSFAQNEDLQNTLKGSLGRVANEADNQASELKQQMEVLQKEVNGKDAELQLAQNKLQDATETIQQLQSGIEAFKGQASDEVANLEAKIAEQKQFMEASQNTIESFTKQLETLELSNKKLKGEKTTLQAQYNAAIEDADHIENLENIGGGESANQESNQPNNTQEAMSNELKDIQIGLSSQNSQKAEEIFEGVQFLQELKNRKAETQQEEAAQ